jgi:hypothetical protein
MRLRRYLSCRLVEVIVETVTVASSRDFALSGYEMILGVAAVAVVAWIIVTGIKHLLSR